MINPTDTATAPPPARWRRAPIILASGLLIVAAWGALELWGLGKAPFHTKGEPREALVVWEMTHGGGWILPKRDGVELPSKPPLFHWLGAMTSLVHGATDEWSIRFPSAALSLLGLLCVFATGVALWNPRAGLTATLALMTMFEWARAATNARVDMTLTFGLVLAFLSLLFFLRSRATGWLIPLYLGITLAVLGKGPVGAALPGLVALLMLALTRDGSFLRRMRLGYGALVVGVLAGSWYVLALLLGGWQFFRKQVLAENVFTFLNNPEFGGGHRHSASYLFGALLLGVLPWTVFLAGVVARLWRQRRTLARDDPRVYLLVWIGVVFGFYALAASKRSVYLLALYPALALLVGWWWDEQSRAPADEERWLARLLPPIVWTLTGVLALLGLIVALEGLGVPVVAAGGHWLPRSAHPFLPWVSDTIRTAPWLLLGLLLVACASTYTCVRAARAARWMRIFASMFCAVAVLLIAVQQVVLPGIAKHKSLRTFMADIRQVVGPGGTISFYKTFSYGAVFYWDAHIPAYDGPWPDGAPRYLLVDETEWDRLKTKGSGRYQQVIFPNNENLGEHGHLVLIRRTGG